MVKAKEHKNVGALFEVIKKRIDLMAEEAGLSEHATTIGEENENSIEGFLISLLPKFFKYGSGVLINHEGEKSKQQDIIIYSPYMSVLTPKSRMFPIDSCFSTIEVKTNLTKEHIRLAMENIASAKRLAKKSAFAKKLQCNIFAYIAGSSSSLLENIKLFKEALDIKDEEMFDNLCVNGKFLITKNKELKRLSGENQDYDYIVMNLEEKSLPYFLDSMISTMEIQDRPIPIFTRYLGNFKMGVETWKLG